MSYQDLNEIQQKLSNTLDRIIASYCDRLSLQERMEVIAPIYERIKSGRDLFEGQEAANE